MINKENDGTEEPKDERESTFCDLAYMDVQCHLVVKDKDTGDVILNKRG